MDRKQLLAEVLKAQRNAGAKVNRLKRNGVNAEAIDPRRDVDRVRRYNSNQLESYRRSLQQFNARDNQYVAGYKGTPLKRAEWEQYKRLEALHNLKVRAQIQRYKNVIVPGSGGLTVQEKRAIDAKNKTFTVHSDNEGFREISREPGQVLNIKKLNSQLRKKVSGPNFINKAINESRKQFEQMLDVIGDESLKDNVKKMSTTQFDFLWNQTRFTKQVSLIYEITKKLLSGKSKSFYGDLISDAKEDIQHYVTETSKAVDR